MKRFLANLALALSLLLLITVAIVWVRSYRVKDHFLHKSYETNGLPYVETWLAIWVRSGRLSVEWSRSVCTAQSPQGKREVFEKWASEEVGWRRDDDRMSWRYYFHTPPSLQFDHLGLYFFMATGYDVWNQPCPYVTVIVPLWLPALILSPPPLLWLRRRLRRRKRLRTGCCIHCGYDLRATPGRCPECGAQSGRVEPA